ncbi:hypothetical protein [Bifidobacterium sp. SO1]|uniref:hypothetical protein n=1 Tax=Bifidobacterium sp. SO1 TaxID=2809029 RepID=UPI001BDD02D6|nr:hypothetical protein [Bifidobacterium sp. SO1]MBT1161280.1 hypothetical protein [Bifidobacterium sp. SO1]
MNDTNRKPDTQDEDYTYYQQIRAFSTLEEYAQMLKHRVTAPTCAVFYNSDPNEPVGLHTVPVSHLYKRENGEYRMILANGGYVDFRPDEFFSASINVKMDSCRDLIGVMTVESCEGSTNDRESLDYPQEV